MNCAVAVTVKFPVTLGMLRVIEVIGKLPSSYSQPLNSYPVPSVHVNLRSSPLVKRYVLGRSSAKITKGAALLRVTVIDVTPLSPFMVNWQPFGFGVTTGVGVGEVSGTVLFDAEIFQV